jgi:hypothetical protein
VIKGGKAFIKQARAQCGNTGGSGTSSENERRFELAMALRDIEFFI